jgi:hypothetical protein
MLRLVLRSRWLRRVSRAVPVAQLLVGVEMALLAQRHINKLDRAQRRRLVTLLVRARGWPRSLTAAERCEFLYLLAKLESRLLFGTTVRRVGPVPVPRRLLYGRRGSAARAGMSRRT